MELNFNNEITSNDDLFCNTVVNFFLKMSFFAIDGEHLCAIVSFFSMVSFFAIVSLCDMVSIFVQ